MAVIIEAIPAVDARAQVERVLQSRIFRSSEVLKHLFGYLADQSLAGTGDSLKEYTIGLDALGKPATFDPRQESVVRMHTARLRQKLAEYYRTEGIDDPILIDLPKGGFKVTFDPRQQVVQSAPVAEPVPAVVVAPSRRWRQREIALAAGLAVALGCALFFMTQLWRVERGENGAAGASSVTWTP